LFDHAFGCIRYYLVVEAYFQGFMFNLINSLQVLQKPFQDDRQFKLCKLISLDEKRGSECALIWAGTLRTMHETNTSDYSFLSSFSSCGIFNLFGPQANNQEQSRRKIEKLICSVDTLYDKSMATT